MEQALKQVRDAFSHGQASKYTLAAAVALVYYDALLTFPLEVVHVWSKKPSLGSFLYVGSKYIVLATLTLTGVYASGFVPQIPNYVCGVLIVLTSVAQTLAMLFASWLLTLRVLALLGNVRFAAVFLYGALFLTYGATYFIIAISMNHSFSSARWIPGLEICALGEIINYRPFRYVFMPAILDETLLTVITVWKSVTYARHGGKTNSLIVNLIRDGVTWFVAIVGLRIANSIIWATLPTTIMQVALWLLWALVSVLINRFFLSLRQTASGQGSVDAFSVEIGNRRKQEIVATRTFGGGTMGLQKRRQDSVMISWAPNTWKDEP